MGRFLSRNNKMDRKNRVNMIKLFFYGICVAICISCNSQKSTDKKTDVNNKKMEEIEEINIKEVPPWDCFSEGEMNFSHSTEDEQTKEFINWSIRNLKSFGYKIPDEKLFRQKVLEYFQLDVEKYDVNLQALNRNLIPYIVIKSEKIISQEEIDSLTLVMFNKMIFYNDESAITYIKRNKPYIINDLVFEFGYSKNEDWIKFAVKDDLWKSKGGNLVLFNLLFGEYNIKGGDYLELRKDMLENLIEMDAELSQLSGVAEDVLNRNDYKFKEDRKYIAGYLYTKCLELKTPQNDIVKSLIDKDSNWIDYFESNNFYNSQKLKTYILDVYLIENKQIVKSNSVLNQVKTGIIKDPDGYTNLRKEKNTNSTILQKINSGDSIEVLDNSSDWFLVKTKEGKQGYVHKSRIKAD